MTARPLADQELVVHVFAPSDGPQSKVAYRQILAIWDQCRNILGMVDEIPNTGLPTRLPPGSDALKPGRPAAAIEDRAADLQAIVRREHDVVNLSMVFAAPLDTPSRRLRIGSASPPGWVEFDRWWDELASAGTDALLGVLRVCQAKFTDPHVTPLDVIAHEVRAVLPGTDHAAYWWQRGWTSEHGFAVWEVSPDDGQADRRIVVVAPEDRDAELSAWTWSQGDPAMPPLGRYLMHAAKLRYQARVRGDGEQLRTVIDRANDRVEDVRTALERESADRAVLMALRLAEADLTSAARDVRTMQRTVEIAADNMTKALATPFGNDRRLSDSLADQLGDDSEYMAAARDAAREIGRLARESHGDVGRAEPGTRARPDEDRAHRVDAAPGAPLRRPGRISTRMGFAVDIVGYSSRTSPDKSAAQERIATLVREVLDDLHCLLESTDRQETGDGMNVFLPVDLELHRALPRLLLSFHERLSVDNARFRDRMRLRMSTAFGPVGLAALGFAGSTIVEVSRLLNSEVLRDALTDHPAADLAVLVSDQLYEYVVGEGYPGLDAWHFERRLIEVKEYRAYAWLWIPE
ncbi:CATRA conflict system CASPASE/TPR repeat-associated protein [Streptomyces sp. NPDC005474]|uniref:CATRA conflict system CASPASE/TPR repeat-associated protein n=1 Tax=Streptomyces sp. NPDC005474 TaxID=3154878 RepID=UPI00345207F1